MYRYDYVLRLIERLGQVLRSVRNRLLQQRDVTDEDIRAELHEIAREAGLDVDFARRLDLGTLTAWLAPVPDKVDEPRVWLMAELLHVEAVHARASGQEQRAVDDLRRALALFARIPPAWRPGDDAPSAGERVAELQALLPPDDGAGDADAR